MQDALHWVEVGSDDSTFSRLYLPYSKLSFNSMTFCIYSHFQTKVTHLIRQGRDDVEQRFSNLRVLGLRLRASGGLGRDARICISNTFPGDADVVGLGMTL